MAGPAGSTRIVDPSYQYISNDPTNTPLPPRCYEGKTVAQLQEQVAEWIKTTGLVHDEKKSPSLNGYTTIANTPALAPLRHKEELLFAGAPHEDPFVRNVLESDFKTIQQGVSAPWVIENVRRLVDILNVHAALGERNETADKVHTLVQRVLLGVGQVGRAYCHLENAEIANNNQTIVDALIQEQLQEALRSDVQDGTYTTLMHILKEKNVDTTEQLEALTRQMQCEIDKFTGVWPQPFDAFVKHFEATYSPNASAKLDARRLHIQECYEALQKLGTGATPIEKFYFLTYLSRFTNTNGKGNTSEVGIFAEVNQTRREIFGFLNDVWMPLLKQNQLSPTLAANLYQNREVVQQALQFAAAADAANGMLCLRGLRSQEGGNPDFAEHPYAHKRLHGTGPGLSFGDESGLLYKLFAKMGGLPAAERSPSSDATIPPLVNSENPPQAAKQDDAVSVTHSDHEPSEPGSPRAADDKAPKSLRAAENGEHVVVSTPNDASDRATEQPLDASGDQAAAPTPDMTGEESARPPAIPTDVEIPPVTPHEEATPPLNALAQLEQMDDPTRQGLVYGELYHILKAAGMIRQEHWELGSMVFHETYGYLPLVAHMTPEQLEGYRLKALKVLDTYQA